jgi:SNF2 family DNA or RNA helicase
MILIANPSAAREGLTLTSANNAIYLDRNFNLVDYLQSQDRIHRISQTKECRIYKLIAKNTIDEYIDEIIYKKHKLAEYVQGDIDNIENNEYLTKDEVLNMLGEQ